VAFALERDDLGPGTREMLARIGDLSE